MPSFLMRVLYLSIAILATGCATPTSQTTEYISPIEGVWVGKLESSFVNADDSEDSVADDLLIAVCGSKAVVWIRPKDKDFRRNTEALPVTSLLNMHRISLFHEADVKPARWAEQQTYTVIAYEEARAKLQWSRAVTNPRAAGDWPQRYFVGYGSADMRRTQDTCDVRLGQR
jgi:hypothetical protein